MHSIQKLVENPTTQSLSQASLEVLAIIAYKQPITRVEIEDIRGVKSERPIHTLSAKGLVQEVGRAEGTGRAILYGTTKEFLQYFGLKDIMLFLHFQKMYQWMKWKTTDLIYDEVSRNI